MGAVLASIPSPPTGVYHVGPLTIHMYGVVLLLAIAAAVWLTGVRWVRWGGDWDLVYRVSIWGVIAPNRYGLRRLEAGDETPFRRDKRQYRRSNRVSAREQEPS